ncbi:MAG: hypothetical protein SO147_02975 [Clostridia bacterium]|nr:hypothetical protein [Clostridia bacterium]
MTNYHVSTNDCCERKTCCNLIPFLIFGALFLFVLGLIIGTMLVQIISANLVAFIILAAILFVLAVVAWIVHRCNCRRKICE